MKYYAIKHDENEFLAIKFNSSYSDYEAYLYKGGIQLIENILYENKEDAVEWIEDIKNQTIIIDFYDAIETSQLEVVELDVILEIKIK